MPVVKRVNFFETEEGASVEAALVALQADILFNTESSYSANAELYPDNRIPFVDKHKKYLLTHPTVDPLSYVSNLRLMTKIR
jgi:hypothetical protein